MIIFILSYSVLYKYIRGIDLVSFYAILQEIISESHSLLLLLFIAVLGCCNWFIESFKWRYVISGVCRISMMSAVKSVLIGVFFSLFIPNRAGDFLGRVFSVAQHDKGKLSVLTLLGSYAQLIATLYWGVLGCTYFVVFHQQLFNPLLLYIYLILGGGWIALLFVIILYFKSPMFARFGFVQSPKSFPNIHSWVEVLKRVSRSKMFMVLIISLIRYLFFALQLWIAYRLVGVDVARLDLFFFVTVYYFVLTFIPTIVFTEIGVRGSLSIYLFGLLLWVTSAPAYNYEWAVSFASVLVWMVNIVFPSILGSFYTYRLKFYTR